MLFCPEPAFTLHLPSLDTQSVGYDKQVDREWDLKTFSSDVFPAAALAASFYSTIARARNESHVVVEDQTSV